MSVAAAVVVVVLAAPLGVNAACTRPVLGAAPAGSAAEYLPNVGRWQAWSNVDGVASSIARAQSAENMVVDGPGFSVSHTLKDLGLVDPTRAIRDSLVSAGRNGPVLQRLIAQTRAVWTGLSVHLPPEVFDDARLAAAVQGFIPRVDRPAVDARITWSADVANTRTHGGAAGATTGGVVVIPDVPGLKLDTTAAETAIRTAAKAGARSVELPTDPVPAAITAADLAPVADLLQAAVARPLELTAGAAGVTIEPAQVYAALPVVIDGKGPHLTTDLSGFAGVLDALAPQAEVAASPQLAMAGVVVNPGVAGAGLDRAGAEAAVLAELTARATGGGSDSVALPLVSVPPPVTQESPDAFSDPAHVHLTFDDGPGSFTEPILDILRDKGVHATFYVNGYHAAGYEGTLNRILAEGHRLGNHTWSHANLTRLSHAGVATEIASVEDLLTQVTGVRPTAFRPPYGSVTEAVRAEAAAQGLSFDLWTIDPSDWASPGVEVIRDRVLAAAQPGSVILLHVLHQQTVDALPQIIDGLRAAGLVLD
jgi:peptidoglycan/xylan/chitin deacetylase (PgdA/CDA1 family)